MTQFSKHLSKITFLVLVGLVFASSVYALQLDYPDWFPISSGMSLTELVGAIFNMFLVVAGVAAFIMIAVGGFRYLTSAGSPSTMADAKSQIFSALLGLVLLLGSFLILNTINPELVALQEPDLTKLGTPTLPTGPGGGSGDQITLTITKPFSYTKQLGSLDGADTIDQGPFKLEIKPSFIELTIGLGPVRKSIAKKSFTAPTGGDAPVTVEIKKEWDVPLYNLLSEDIRNNIDQYVNNGKISVDIKLLIPPPPVHEICLYAETDWKPTDEGECFAVGQELAETAVGKKYYSVKIKPGYAIKFYSEYHFGQRDAKWAEICFKGSYDNFGACGLSDDWGGAKGNWEDDIRSFKVITADQCLNERETFLCTQGQSPCDPRWEESLDDHCPPPVGLAPLFPSN